jgi:hypothetical protein
MEDNMDTRISKVFSDGLTKIAEDIETLHMSVYYNNYGTRTKDKPFEVSWSTDKEKITGDFKSKRGSQSMCLDQEGFKKFLIDLNITTFEAEKIVTYVKEKNSMTLFSQGGLTMDAIKDIGGMKSRIRDYLDKVKLKDEGEESKDCPVSSGQCEPICGH